MTTRSRRASLLWLGLGLGGSTLLASCTSPPPSPQKEDDGDRLWPMPPELPRFAFETVLRSVADVQVDSDETLLQRRLTGARRPDERVLEKPSGVAARAGRVYVTDAVRRSIVVFDVPRRRVFQIGLRAPGTLAKPTAIAIDRARRVYVADATLRKVLVYDALGLFLNFIGDASQLQRPTGVAVSADGSRIYVIDRADNDSEQHRVMAYAADGTLLRDIGKRGRHDGEFNVPVQGVVSPDGRLHVLDAGNFRVQSFDPDGRFVRSFGNVGSRLNLCIDLANAVPSTAQLSVPRRGISCCRFPAFGNGLRGHAVALRDSLQRAWPHIDGSPARTAWHRPARCSAPERWYPARSFGRVFG